MHLSDGRRILLPEVAAEVLFLPVGGSGRPGGGWEEGGGGGGAEEDLLATSVIPIHPEFRMFVLANRPGFPFLGNDFFKEFSGTKFASSEETPSS